MAGVEVILIFSDLPMFLQAVPAIDYYSPVIVHMQIMKVSRKSCKVLWSIPTTLHASFNLM